MIQLETKVFLEMIVSIAKEEDLSEKKRLEMITKSIEKHINHD